MKSCRRSGKPRRKATWIASTLLSLAVGLGGCASRKAKVVIVPGEARVIQQLPNGNYEVTPLFLLERARYEQELEKQLLECEGK